VWLSDRTGNSVLLVAIFHASFDAAINQLYDVVVPGSATANFLIFSGVIVLYATAVIIATKGSARAACSGTIRGTQHSWRAHTR
jgi:hypothetical protein